MKESLAATTAPAVGEGAALAEMTIPGDAKFGLDRNFDSDAGMSRHAFTRGMGIDPSAPAPPTAARVPAGRRGTAP